MRSSSRFLFFLPLALAGSFFLVISRLPDTAEAALAPASLPAPATPLSHASPNAAAVTRLLTGGVKGGIKPASSSPSKGGSKKKGGAPTTGAGAGAGAGAGGALGKSKAKGRSTPPPAEILHEEEEEEEDFDDEEEEEDDEEWDDEEEEYEEEEYEEDEEEAEDVYAARRGSARNRRPNDWHYADRRRQQKARRGSNYGVMGLFKGAAKLTGNSVSNVAGLFQPNKYVGLREVIGVWKVKQKVSERPGELERCEATLEIRKDGTVVTFFEGKELVSEFLFKERQWPRSCIIEFEARAFQGPYDREPQLKFFKGYVRRSLMNSHQVRIEGKIYEVKGTFFWRQKRQVGRFRAVKRER